MDPCPFVRVLVGDLALKLPPPPAPSPSARGAGTHVHPTTAHCYCRIRLDGVPYQTATAPLLPPTEDGGPASCTGGALAAAFHLSKPDIDRAADRGGASSALLRAFRPRHGAARLKVAVYVARCGGGGADERGGGGGAKKRGRLLGKVALPLDLRGSGALARPVVFHAGWVSIAKGRRGGSSKGELHLTVRADPDPRFVFQFEGEPERSPLVMQVRGGMRQPMFTCRFSSSCRAGDLRSRSAHSSDLLGFGGSFPAPTPDLRRSRTGWLARLGSARLDAGGGTRSSRGECRKGWSVTVHDLSGSPVALASMVTPFAASPGTDRVGRSSPGAWLLLRPRPADGAWTPWGRLECWRDDRRLLAYRFHHLVGAGAPRVVAESALGAARGGRFAIDLTAEPPVDLSGSGSGDLFGAGGFVMAADVQGEGRPSRPTVEVGVAHVGCAEDAAAFVALAAAVDLSVDACRLFSCRLRRELSSSAAA